MSWEWVLIKRNCTGCGICADVCNMEAIYLTRDMAYPEPVKGKCNGCSTCYNECPFDAVEIKEVKLQEAP